MGEIGRRKDEKRRVPSSLVGLAALGPHTVAERSEASAPRVRSHALALTGVLAKSLWSLYGHQLH